MISSPQLLPHTLSKKHRTTFTSISRLHNVPPSHSNDHIRTTTRKKYNLQAFLFSFRAVFLRDKNRISLNYFGKYEMEINIIILKVLAALSSRVRLPCVRVWKRSSLGDYRAAFGLSLSLDAIKNDYSFHCIKLIFFHQSDSPSFNAPFVATLFLDISSFFFLACTQDIKSCVLICFWKWKIDFYFCRALH